MADIKDFRNWLKRDFSPKDVVLEHTDQSSDEYRIYLFTETNRYSIVARRDRLTTGFNDEDGYLGCIAQSRKSRTGEDWFRGNDLPDGDLSEETWRRIVIGILRYELQEICRKDL